MNFRTLKEGDYISAREWNALVAFIQGMARSTMTDGIMDSTGFHPRRRLITPPQEIHLAYCKTAAGTGNTIVCYLDTDTTGIEITVYCKLYEGGTNLSACAPLLADGDEMKVVQIGGYWRSLTTFFESGTC